MINKILSNSIEWTSIILFQFYNVGYQQNNQVMQSLRKRQFNQPFPADTSLPNKEPLFMERLSQAIKIFKKKQDFYIKVLFIVPQPQRPFTSKQETFDHKNGFHKISELQAQHEEMVSEEQQICNNIKKYEKEAFFHSKTYLYTIFVRLTEIIQSAKQKILTKLKSTQVTLRSGWERIYDDNKLSLVQSYQNLVYFQTYDAYQLLNVAKRKQNHRTFALVPPKVKKSQITLNPIQRSDSSKINKTASVQIPSPNKKEKLQSIIAVKLKKKNSKKVMIQKRGQEQKKGKEKQKDRQKNMFKCIYGILNIKNIKVQDRKQMQEETLQRNQGIREIRQDYKQKLELRNIYIRLSKRKKTQENKKQPQFE